MDDILVSVFDEALMLGFLAAGAFGPCVCPGPAYTRLIRATHSTPTTNNTAEPVTNMLHYIAVFIRHTWLIEWNT